MFHKLRLNSGFKTILLIVLALGLATLLGLLTWRPKQLADKKQIASSHTRQSTASITNPTKAPTEHTLVSHDELIACAKQMGASFVGPRPTTPEAAQQGELRCTVKTGTATYTNVYSTPFPNLTATSGAVQFVDWSQLDAGLRQTVQAQWQAATAPSSCITTTHLPATVTTDGAFARVPTCTDGGTVANFWTKSNNGWTTIGHSGQFGDTCSPYVDYRMPLQVGLANSAGQTSNSNLCFDDNDVQRFISTSQ